MKRIWIIGLAALAAACGKPASDVMQGYGEADYIYLASQEAGVVGDVFVTEGEEVAEGAPIFRLDPERLSYGASQASANRGALTQAVEAAEANSRLARLNYTRSAELFERGFQARARLDADRAARDAADARLDQARRELTAASAATGLAEERVSDLQGAAPRAGRIERIFHRSGEVVAAGAPIATLLAPENLKVRFFAPQAMLSRLHLGGAVALSCDGCAENLTGTISYIATEPQFTPPIIYSLEQREKLVFLVEAHPAQPDAIRPGMPIDVRLAAP
jgi:HlyD family secretion protein